MQHIAQLRGRVPPAASAAIFFEGAAEREGPDIIKLRRWHPGPSFRVVRVAAHEDDLAALEVGQQQTREHKMPEMVGGECRLPTVASPGRRTTGLNAGIADQGA